MRIKLFSNKVNTKSSLRNFLYLVVVGVETLDGVDAEEDVDTELEVEALRTIILIQINWHFNGFMSTVQEIKRKKVDSTQNDALYKLKVKQFNI